jgi:hypothetical protein
MLHVAKHGAKHSIQELEIETALTLNTEKDYRYRQTLLLFNLHLFHGKITVSDLQQNVFSKRNRETRLYLIFSDFC